MAHYFVGDIQGCCSSLQKLLAKINFNPKHDRLCCVGDLVGRGPEPLAVLRYLRNLGDSAVCVLGNHDLHCLAAYHNITTAKPADNLDCIYQAPDTQELMSWLQTRPLIATFPEHRLAMVHAGIPPHWDLQEALLWAEKTAQALQNPETFLPLLKAMYIDKSPLWQDLNTDFERAVYTLNALTRLRFCTAQGGIDFTCKDKPQNLKDRDLHPWYTLRAHQQASDPQIIFGHWSALEGELNNAHFQALDTGCIWGGCLTAWCAQTQTRTQINCSD